MPQTVYVRMSPQMCFEMNPLIRSCCNDSYQFLTNVDIFALPVALHFPLRLPFGAIAVSQKWIYIRGIGFMIQLDEAEASPEGTYKVV